MNINLLLQRLTLIVVMKAVDTRSSNSITGVYSISTLTICQGKVKITINTQETRALARSGWQSVVTSWTWAVLRAVHRVQMAWASASVFLLICSSWAACLSGSRVSLAPQSVSCRSVSHSCSCHTLYLKTKTSRPRHSHIKTSSSNCNNSPSSLCLICGLRHQILVRRICHHSLSHVTYTYLCEYIYMCVCIYLYYLCTNVYK